MMPRDRVRELRRVKASELKANPRNWRLHPPHQRWALQGMLHEIGYAGALVARECPDGSLELIDGHLRAELSAEDTVPVLVVDVSDAEANVLLATMDPIAALAERDDAAFAELAASLETNHQSLRGLLEGMLERTTANGGGEVPSPEVELTPRYQVVVECGSEEEQRTVYELLKREGWRCRVLTL